MTIIQTIVFFIICWWMVFFLALPFKVRDNENRITGQAASAPKNPYIKEKMVIASILTLIITLIFRYYVS